MILNLGLDHPNQIEVTFLRQGKDAAGDSVESSDNQLLPFTYVYKRL
jgi:hypothetical protein